MEDIPLMRPPQVPEKEGAMSIRFSHAGTMKPFKE